MTINLRNRKILIVSIIFASAFQLITFILSQINIYLDQEAENLNYKIIVNQIKMNDLDVNMRKIIKIYYTQTYMDNIIFENYENNYLIEEANLSQGRYVNNLIFYLKYIKENFFIKNLNLDNEIKLIFINFNLIQDKKEQVKYLLSEIIKIGNKLGDIEKELSFQNDNLKTSMDKIKHYSHIFHILIVFMQILNALFLLIFFYFLINFLAFAKKNKS